MVEAGGLAALRKQVEEERRSAEARLKDMKSGAGGLGGGSLSSPRGGLEVAPPAAPPLGAMPSASGAAGAEEGGFSFSSSSYMDEVKRLKQARKKSIFSTELEQSNLSVPKQRELRRQHANQLEQSIKEHKRALETRHWFQGEGMSWHQGASGKKQDAYSEIMTWAKQAQADRAAAREFKATEAGPPGVPEMVDEGSQARRGSILKATSKGPAAANGGALAVPPGMMVVPIGYQPGAEPRVIKRGKKARAEGDVPRKAKSKKKGSKKPAEAPPVEAPPGPLEAPAPPPPAPPAPQSRPAPPSQMPPPAAVPAPAPPAPALPESVRYEVPGPRFHPDLYPPEAGFPFDISSKKGKSEIEIEVFKMMNATWAKREDELQKYLESEVQRLRVEVQTHEKQRQELVRENAQLRQAGAESSHVKAKLEHEQESNAVLREQVGRLQGLNAVLTEEVKHLKVATAAMGTDSGPEIAQLREMNKRLKESNLELLEEQKELHKTEDELLSEVEELRTKLKSLDISTDSLQLRALHAEQGKALEEKCAEVEALQVKVGQLEGMLDNHAQLELEVAEVRAKLARSHQENEKLQLENIKVSSVTESNAHIAAELNDLRTELDVLRNSPVKNIAASPVTMSPGFAKPGAPADLSLAATPALAGPPGDPKDTLAHYLACAKPPMDFLRLKKNGAVKALLAGAGEASVVFSDLVFKREGAGLLRFILLLSEKSCYVLQPESYACAWQAPLLNTAVLKWDLSLAEEISVHFTTNEILSVHTPRRDAIAGLFAGAMKGLEAEGAFHCSDGACEIRF